MADRFSFVNKKSEYKPIPSANSRSNNNNSSKKDVKIVSSSSSISTSKVRTIQFVDMNRSRLSEVECGGDEEDSAGDSDDSYDHLYSLSSDTNSAEKKTKSPSKASKVTVTYATRNSSANKAKKQSTTKGSVTYGTNQSDSPNEFEQVQSRLKEFFCNSFFILSVLVIVLSVLLLYCFDEISVCRRDIEAIRRVEAASGLHCPVSSASISCPEPSSSPSSSSSSSSTEQLRCRAAYEGYVCTNDALFLEIYRLRKCTCPPIDTSSSPSSPSHPSLPPSLPIRLDSTSPLTAFAGSDGSTDADAATDAAADSEAQSV